MAFISCRLRMRASLAPANNHFARSLGEAHAPSRETSFKPAGGSKARGKGAMCLHIQCGHVVKSVMQFGFQTCPRGRNRQRRGRQFSSTFRFLTDSRFWISSVAGEDELMGHAPSVSHSQAAAQKAVKHSPKVAQARTPWQQQKGSVLYRTNVAFVAISRNL